MCTVAQHKHIRAHPGRAEVCHGLHLSTSTLLRTLLGYSSSHIMTYVCLVLSNIYYEYVYAYVGWSCQKVDNGLLCLCYLICCFKGMYLWFYVKIKGRQIWVFLRLIQTLIQRDFHCLMLICTADIFLPMSVFNYGAPLWTRHGSRALGPEVPLKIQ